MDHIESLDLDYTKLLFNIMNRSTEEEIGAKFKNVIVPVLNNSKEREERGAFISLKEAVECLKEVILKSFDSSVSPQERQNFQDTWKQRIICSRNSIGIIVVWYNI
ncbi:unnamed protein product [Cunninghamella echinulata]